MKKARSKTKRKHYQSQNVIDEVQNHFKKYRIHHKIAFTLLGVSGVVLVWRGLWAIFDITPLINHPAGSLVVGLLLVTLSGYFYKIS